ncbi:MAG: hypothetical protein HC915_17615 [Anaerolineae bacterium]|nr:hypothetical protein [Anaerolineae bacterium]
MMELTLFLQICMGFFGIIGFLHGVYREFVATLGIVLGLWLITEFDWVLNVVLNVHDPGLNFAFSALLLIIFVFFAYQQAPTTFVPSRYRKGRGIRLPEYKGWQMRLMGAVLGAFNGYLVVGSLWYFMDQFEYPLSSLFMMPVSGSNSAEFVNNLPLVWLQQNNLLLAIIIAIVVLVIVFR